MKHTLALVLMLFGIVGCATSDSSSQTIDGEKIFNPLHPNYSKNINDYYQKLESPKAQAIAIRPNGLVKTSAAGYTLRIIDGGAQYLSQKEVNSVVLNKCEEKFNLKCLIADEGGKNVWSDNQAVYQNTPIAIAAREERTLREKAAAVRLAKRVEIIEAKKKRQEKTRIAQEELRKKEILVELNERCLKYGFTGASNISACVQREAQHDKELAIQRLELQRTKLALEQVQSRVYAQNVTQSVEEEEDIPFLIKFLGDVAIGVAEAYADPAFHRDVQQQKEINQLKANQNRDIYRNCRPNC